MANEPILTHRFANGLVLVAEPMPWLESAAFTILVPSGSVNEPEGLSGLATVTCEMAGRGAGDRDNRRFVNDLDSLGVERGESVSDAHTGFSGATLARNLPAALSIYADLLLRPRFPEDQLESARQVVLQDLRGIEDDPAQKVMLELRRRQYPEPWGRPTQGTVEGVQHVSLPDVWGQFHQCFRPNGAIIGIAGRVDWPALKGLIEELLGGWEEKPVPEVREGRIASRIEHLTHDSNQTQIAIAYDSVPYRHPDYFQAWGGVGVLSGGMSARLFTEVREKRGLCYTVYATYHTLLDRGSVFCYAGTSAERAQETLDVTLSELVRLAEGVKEEELLRLKARIKSGLIMQQESSIARSGSIARDYYHLKRARTLDEVGALVDGLTCQSINSYLSAHPPGQFAIVTLGPQPLEVPLGVS